jgi:hypothetical protein
MTECILCLVAFILLCWVILLETRVMRLRNETRKLREMVEERLRAYEAGVKVSGARKIEYSEPRAPERNGSKSRD